MAKNQALQDDIQKFDSTIDNLLSMDYKKAGRYVIKGMIIAILFGAILMTSRSVSSNASTWQELADEKNTQKYEAGVLSYDEYTERQHEISETYYKMQLQDLYVVNIARVFISLGLLLVTIGFIGFATNKELDPKSRNISMFLAGMILLLMMFTTFFSNVYVSLS